MAQWGHHSDGIRGMELAQVSHAEPRSQLIIVVASLKLVWLLGVVFAVLVVDDSPATAAIVAAASMLLGAVLLKPVRLRTFESGASLGVLRRLRSETWSSDEIAEIQ